MAALDVGGEVFLRVLQMIVVPLVMASVMSGILGMGDILTLIERAESSLDQEKAQRVGERLLAGHFGGGRGARFFAVLPQDMGKVVSAAVTREPEVPGEVLVDLTLHDRHRRGGAVGGQVLGIGLHRGPGQAAFGSQAGQVKVQVLVQVGESAHWPINQSNLLSNRQPSSVNKTISSKRIPPQPGR